MVTGTLPDSANSAAGYSWTNPEARFGDGGGPASGSAVAGPLSAAVSRSLHPASNTGCAKPNTDTDTSPAAVEFHLDYLTLTVFASSPAEVQELAERLAAIIGRLWERFAPTPPAWYDRGAAAHWSAILCGPPGVNLKCPRDPDACYVSLEMKGEAFTWLMSEDVRSLDAELDLLRLDALVTRWHATRVDLAFDRLGITPAQMRGWYDTGAVRSKGRFQQHRWFENEQGQTFYFESGPRQCRLYNRRGYNRLELELKEQHAREAYACLIDLPCSQWATHAVARLRSLVDFIDPTTDFRRSRCDLLPEWAALVSDVAAARLLPRKRPDVSSTPAGKMNAKLARVRRALWVLRSACSTREDFDRIIHHAADRYGLEKGSEPQNKGRDAVEVEGLRAWMSFVDGHTDPREMQDMEAMLAELSEDPDGGGGISKSPPPF